MDWRRRRRAAHRTLRFETIEPRLLLSADWAGLDRIRTAYGLTGQGQTVAVIDTGIAYRHTALGNGFGTGKRVVGGFDFAEQDADPKDDGPRGGHGTHVAGIIGSSNPAHLGLAPGVDLVALRVFDDSGTGSLGSVQDAVEWVHAHRNDFRYPITTVNIALSVPSNSSTLPGWESLEDALAQLKADGIFVAVAAGNGFSNGRRTVNYPAGSPHVVPVAAADASGSLLSSTQRDSRCLVAPGSSILSTVPDYDGNHNGRDDDFASYSGTSMAAAFVSGASVLLREACQVAGVQNITQQSLYNLMVSTADTVRDPATGRSYHRLNLGRAIDAVSSKDDYGSSASAARDFGTLATTRSVSGSIERRTDSDWFRFAAAQTGKVTLRAQCSGELQPVWKLPAGVQGTRPADGSLVLDVVAGQKFSFGLASRSGPGRYTIRAELAPSAVQPGSGGGAQPVPTPYRIDTAGTWFTVTAPADGSLSIQAAFSNARGDVDLQLFDTAGRLVAWSSTTNDTEQIDVQATAGTKYRLRAFTYPGTGTNDQVDFCVTSLNKSGKKTSLPLAMAAVDLLMAAGGM
jgi:hypothetical protein